MNWKTPTPVVDGKFVKAQFFNQSLVTNMSETYHRLAYRSADLAKVNDAVLTVDPQLFFVVNADEMWYFEAHCRFFSAVNGGPNIQIRWSYPIPGEMNGYGDGLATDSITWQQNMTISDTGLGDQENYYATTVAKTIVTRQLLFARTAGTVGLMWAQGASGASHTTMMKGSNIQGCKLGPIPPGATTPFIT